MKHFPILLILLCAGCATAPIYHRVYEYDIPAHKLIVCDQFTLDHLFPKPLVYGKCFTNGVKKIYCVGKKDIPNSLPVMCAGTKTNILFMGITTSERAKDKTYSREVCGRLGIART